LIAALSKYWRPVDLNYYMDYMGLAETKAAVTVAAFPKEVSDWIFEPIYIKKASMQRIA